jgi:quinolinate synthase
MKDNPGRRVLILPDKHLAAIFVGIAVKNNNPWINPDLVDFFDGACHVHEQKIVRQALDMAMEEYPKADLLIRPECGCAAECMARASRGEIKSGFLFLFDAGDDMACGQIRHQR